VNSAPYPFPNSYLNLLFAELDAHNSIWSLPVIFICQNNRYAEHSQFARYTAGADVAARAICQRLHCALVLFKKSRRYLPRSAFGQAIDYALSNWPLLGVYL
jgi:hypothetical protein